MKYYIAPEMFQNEEKNIIMGVEDNGVLRYFKSDADSEWMEGYRLWLSEGNTPEEWAE